MNYKRLTVIPRGKPTGGVLLHGGKYLVGGGRKEAMRRRIRNTKEDRDYNDAASRPRGPFLFCPLFMESVLAGLL